MIDLLSAYNQKCDLRRATQSTSASGTTISTMKVLQQNVPCRIGPLSGSESQRYGRYTSGGGSKVSMGPNATLTAKDIVVQGSREFEVKFVEPRYDDAGIQFETFAVLEQIK